MNGTRALAGLAPVQSLAVKAADRDRLQDANRRQALRPGEFATPQTARVRAFLLQPQTGPYWYSAPLMPMVWPLM